MCNVGAALGWKNAQIPTAVFFSVRLQMLWCGVVWWSSIMSGSQFPVGWEHVCPWNRLPCGSGSILSAKCILDQHGNSYRLLQSHESISEVFRCTKYSPTSKPGACNLTNCKAWLLAVRGARLRKYCSQVLGVVKRHSTLLSHKAKQSAAHHCVSTPTITDKHLFQLLSPTKRKSGLSSDLQSGTSNQGPLIFAWATKSSAQRISASTSHVLILQLLLQACASTKNEETCCSPCNRCNLDDSTGQPKATSKLRAKNRKPMFLGFSINPIEQPDLGHTPVFLNQRQIIAESSSWLNQPTEFSQTWWAFRNHKYYTCQLLPTWPLGTFPLQSFRNIFMATHFTKALKRKGRIDKD